jgi:hypothetical protein
MIIIKMDLKQIWYNQAKFILGGVYWQAHVNTVLNLRIT